MLQYVHTLMNGGSAPDEQGPALAARMRWNALNRAFGDERLARWTWHRHANQVHVPVALIAAAGVAPLTMADEQVVFDIPALLDATLQFCEPAGNA
ncbi:MAG TPA: hypothetical protein VMU86_01510 [Steroidobacteraceae bacterium]|nr:hypothetical protein [Steroidobacteraceae bacterium]